MPNQYVLQRIAGIQAILNGVHRAGTPMSSATKGHERAAFIDQFLKEALPPQFRFGTGDVTDRAGHRSGQLDVVVEIPFAPSLPLAAASRLYLAEGVGAVIEVKSDVASQWGEAVRTAELLWPLQRDFLGSVGFIGAPPQPRIPLFVVGYTGWKTIETVREHLQERTDIEGILVIDQGIYVSRRGVKIEHSAAALWGLVSDLYFAVKRLAATGFDSLVYLH
jgi:hypothetical protein